MITYLLRPYGNMKIMTVNVMTKTTMILIKALLMVKLITSTTMRVIKIDLKKKSSGTFWLINAHTAPFH